MDSFHVIKLHSHFSGIAIRSVLNIVRFFLFFDSLEIDSFGHGIMSCHLHLFNYWLGCHSLPLYSVHSFVLCHVVCNETKLTGPPFLSRLFFLPCSDADNAFKITWFYQQFSVVRLDFNWNGHSFEHSIDSMVKSVQHIFSQRFVCHFIFFACRLARERGKRKRKRKKKSRLM